MWNFAIIFKGHDEYILTTTPKLKSKEKALAN